MQKKYGALFIAIAIAATTLPAAAQPSPVATVYQNARGGKAVVGRNGKRTAAQSANGSNAHSGPHGSGYNGKNSAAYSGRHSSGTYNKNTGTYNVNGANVQCSGTKDAQGNCVKK